MVPQSLTTLPPELTLAIVSYLPTSDLCQLRLVCRYLEESTVDALAKERFRFLRIVPTRHVLARLLDLAKNVKFRSYVKKLSICVSFFAELGSAFRKTGISPVLSSRHPAHDTITFLVGGDFQDQLTTVLCSLQIEHFEIRRYTYPWDIWGRREIKRQEDEETEIPFQKGFISPELFASIINAVLASIIENRLPISSLAIDTVEVDRLQVLQQPPSSTYVAKAFSCLTRLDIMVQISESEARRLEINRSESSASSSVVNDPSRYAIIQFLNSLVSLEDLGVSFSHHRSSICNTMLENMFKFAQHIPIHTFRLRQLEEPIPGLVTFLAQLPRLRVLELSLRLYSIEPGEKLDWVAPWKQWLPLLDGDKPSVLSLECLVIDTGSGRYTGYGADGINNVITELLEMPLKRWHYTQSEVDEEERREGEGEGEDGEEGEEDIRAALELERANSRPD